MMDLRTDVQRILGTGMIAYDIDVFPQIYREITGKENPAEYIVFTISGDDKPVFADNNYLIFNHNIYVRYYYSDSVVFNISRISEIENAIINLMMINGYVCATGASDLGDIDDVNYNVSGFEFSTGEVV